MLFLCDDTRGHDVGNNLPLFTPIQMTVLLSFAHCLQGKLSALFIKLILSCMLIFFLGFCISLILKFHFDVSLLCAEVFR